MKPQKYMAIIYLQEGRGLIGKLISDIDGLNEIYKEVAILVGIDGAYMIYQYFSGQQITFPVKWLSKDYVARIAAKRYDGKNLKSLAKEYGYSERWLRQIIKDRQSLDMSNSD